jgi:hypothetical protein
MPSAQRATVTKSHAPVQKELLIKASPAYAFRVFTEQMDQWWPRSHQRARHRAGYKLAEDVRYNERSAAERVNGRLKDEFGGRIVRVRGHAKVACHLMFGILALTCDLDQTAEPQHNPPKLGAPGRRHRRGP